MSSVAEQLLLARQAQSLTVNQVAEITKIRTDHIRALEEGNFNVFSAPVYIRGFVRAYAGVLKLNVTAVMADLDTELRQTEKFAEPPSLTGHKKGVLDFLMLQLSKLNWRVALVAAIALVLLIVISSTVYAVRRNQRADPLANLPPATYHAPQSGETAPLPTLTPRR